jgi:large subunit ribosomal protein L25
MTRLISLKVDSDKEPRRVFIREIQKDPLSGKLLHVDFYQVKRSEKIKMDVPIVLVGEAPAMKAKRRVLTYTTTSLSIECLPDKIPPVIEVDLSPLVDLEKAIYVKDIVLDPDIAVLTDPEQMIVKVSEMAAEVEEAAVKVEEVAVEEAAAEAAPTEEKEEE